MAKLVFLKTEKEFEQFRKSKGYQSAVLKIRIVWTKDQNAPRFGFIIPKKILPKVVDRNLIKRRLKGILLKQLPQLKPANVLFFPSKFSLRKKYSDLEAETIGLLKKSGIWKS